MQNYFSLFQLPQQFDIDLALLNTNYRVIQTESHPDRFVTATSAKKLSSMQIATTANEAYQTLKNPANRAIYLLKLQNIDAISETNTVLPATFLMQQMEWRETLEDAKQAKDINALNLLLSEMRAETARLQANLVDVFDKKHDLIAATDATRKLIFIDKVCADVSKSIATLEDNL
ncbi:MAG: Fe-S protein assembly co-chaperone HscB [Methylophilaceae bacterium]|nr:Fe-S protein assembly co-chaperone HscB [Methylophilaceae bacterium]